MVFVELTKGDEVELTGPGHQKLPVLTRPQIVGFQLSTEVEIAA
jgi:hypothetical protein